MLDLLVQSWLLLTLSLLGLLVLVIAVQAAVGALRRTRHRLGQALEEGATASLVIRDVSH